VNHGRRFVAERLVQAHAGQCPHELEAAEAASAGLAFAALQQRPADAAAGMIGIDEKSADLGRIDLRVELARVALGVAVATEQRTAVAPTAAADQLSFQLHDEVGAILDELRIDSECTAQRPLDLLRLVILRSELAGGARNQVLQRALISVSGRAELVVHRLQYTQPCEAAGSHYMIGLHRIGPPG